MHTYLFLLSSNYKENVHINTSEIFIFKVNIALKLCTEKEIIENTSIFVHCTIMKG